MKDSGSGYNTLLTSLVRARRSLQPEPVATFALHHVLSTSTAARVAMASLGSEIDNSGDYSDLEWTEQSGSADGAGRPDLIGSNSSGPRLLIEAKFDAGLTVTQSGTGYLDALTPDTPGVLAYLVPDDRRHLLWRQLLLKTCGVAERDLDSHTSDAQILRFRMPDQRVVAVLTWPFVLQKLEAGIAAAGDTRALADLQQLAALVEDRTRTGWVPLSGQDLSGLTGRQLEHLKNTTLSVAQEVSIGTVRQGSNDRGPARWVCAKDGSRIFWVGVRMPDWARFGHSPVWAVIVERDHAKRSACREALRSAVSDVSEVINLDSNTVGVPIIVPPGAEQDEVRQSLRSQLTAVRVSLESIGAASADDSTTSPSGTD